MKSIIYCILFLLSIQSLFAQTTIKDFYDIFPFRFKPEEALGTMYNADTTIDIKNAYLRIQSKPNDCCTDYAVFTFFKTVNGEKIFAYEKGGSTTASDDAKTTFYTFTNKKWKVVTKKVFSFSFSFKDFWMNSTLPPKKFQVFKTHIKLPKVGTKIFVYVWPIDMVDWDTYIPKSTDSQKYDDMFRKYELFYKLEYEWDKKKGVFLFKGKTKQEDYL